MTAFTARMREDYPGLCILVVHDLSDAFLFASELEAMSFAKENGLAGKMFRPDGTNLPAVQTRTHATPVEAAGANRRSADSLGPSVAPTAPEVGQQAGGPATIAPTKTEKPHE
jgi:hypothetical protein